MKCTYFPDLRNSLARVLMTDLLMSLLGIPCLHVKRIATGSIRLIEEVCLVWGEVLALVGKVESGNTLGLTVLASTSGAWAQTLPEGGPSRHFPWSGLEQALPALGMLGGLPAPDRKARCVCSVVPVVSVRSSRPRGCDCPAVIPRGRGGHDSPSGWRSPAAPRRPSVSVAAPSLVRAVVSGPGRPLGALAPAPGASRSGFLSGPHCRHLGPAVPSSASSCGASTLVATGAAPF